VTITAQTSDNSQPGAPHIPDVSGLTPIDAALAYARAGLYVLPVATGKHPGSIVGKGWPQCSTRDPEVIECYWGSEDPPGIALHTGRSNLIAFDLDIDVLPDELLWLKPGLFQSSRSGRGARGHYVFASAETFVSGGLKLADGTVAGDIRSGNTVIMAQPSPHPKAGGGYLWRTTGPVPALTDEARAWLTTRAGGADGASWEPASDETLAAFMAEHRGNSRPKVLTALAKSVANAKSGTRNLTRDALRIAAKEARIGFYPFAMAISEIERAARHSYAQRRESFDAHIGATQFGQLVKNAVGQALAADEAALVAEATRDYGTNSTDDANEADWFTSITLRDEAGNVAEVIPISKLSPNGSGTESDGSTRQSTRFRGVSAAELAAPVTPMRWLVRGAWPQRSAGVLAGEKKTFKTWNLQAMAIAVAAGVPFLDQFEVSQAQPVLYLCGEGGRDGFANRHQVIAKRYGLTLDDLAALPFMAEFDTDQLDSAELVDGIKRHLDTVQPALVVLDPLYAYHPANVEASNLYARGPMLAKLRELIEGHAALAIGDHFKKNTGDALDLDNISMAGVAQWSDTWILQRHRADPDLTRNDYKLEVEFATRRSGGSRYEIDWHLDRDNADPDVVSWKSCDWVVSAPSDSSVTTPQRDFELKIVREIYTFPWQMTRADLHSKLGGRKKAVLDAVKRLLDKGELGEREPGRGKAMLLGPGKLIVGLPPAPGVTP